MERPIILKAHEVRGILDGRQTQLRRIIKGMEYLQGPIYCGLGYSLGKGKGHLLYPNAKQQVIDLCPFGQVGDRLWGRETFTGGKNWVAYKTWEGITSGLPFGDHPTKWKSSTQMPRWASRILLEIVSVRVERLQDICDEDLGRMGYDTRYINPDGRSGSKYASAYTAYKLQFMELYGEEQWKANPWLWVLETKRLKA